MFRIGCSVLLIIVSLTTTQCDEHCPKEEHLSKGLATSFIKFLDFVFDFVVQAFFGKYLHRYEPTLPEDSLSIFAFAYTP